MTLDVSPLPSGPVQDQPAADLAARARADGVKFLLALFVDLAGKPCAKLVPVEAASELQYEGVGFAGYAVGAIGQRPSDPDLIAIPDLASYTPCRGCARGWPSCTAIRTSRASRGRSRRA